MRINLDTSLSTEYEPSLPITDDEEGPVAHLKIAIDKLTSFKCFKQIFAASSYCPASAKKVAESSYRCFESNAYAFFNAASWCLFSLKSRDKNSNNFWSRFALYNPANTDVRPKHTKSNAHDSGSFVFANEARAALSRIVFKVVSLRSQIGTPSMRKSRQAIWADEDV